MKLTITTRDDKKFMELWGATQAIEALLPKMVTPDAGLALRREQESAERAMTRMIRGVEWHDCSQEVVPERAQRREVLEMGGSDD